MKKIKIEIKNRWTGKIIFEYETENNTIKNTVIEAVNKGADLRDTDLQGADLRGADLRDTDLQGADLQGADLRGADLRGANLYSADLRGAYLRGADIDTIKHLYQIIPETGTFIAWKKLANQCIAKIEIPTKAKRTCNFINRKCRAKYVKTIQIIDNNGNEIKEMHGLYDKNTIYKVNRLTHADKFDNNMLLDCTHGIHFFVTKKEAEDWN